MDSIQMMYDDKWGHRHGGSGGDKHYFHFGYRKVVKVEGRSGWLLDKIAFITDDGRRHGPIGRNGGQPWSVSHRGWNIFQ